MPDELVVDEGLAVEVERGQLVGGHDPGPERGREVLALGRAEADLHLAGLDVAGGPVVEDRVAEDRGPAPPRPWRSGASCRRRRRPPSRSPAPGTSPAAGSPRPGRRARAGW